MIGWSHLAVVPQTATKPGFLIAIEGIDGAGKTTQAQVLQKALEQEGLEVLYTKEPTTGQFGQILRNSAESGRLSLEEEVELFMKDRREHVRTKIQPALAAGQVVIVDRYYFSTAAYQGCRGLDPAELMRANEEFAPEPDLLIVLDLEPNGGLKRIGSRGDQANHFEKSETLEKARSIFLGIQKPYKVVIDAAQAAERVAGLMVAEFWRRYREKQGPAH